MSMTLRLIIFQASYFILFCSSFIFANPVLDYRGYDINTIGFILTLGPIIAIVFQPIIAKLISDINFITNKRVLLFFIILVFFLNIIAFSTNNEAIVSICYILIVTAMLTTQTFIYTFIFDYINSGIKLNFGLARGMGSLAFALTSLIVGYFAKSYGYDFIKYINAIVSLILICSLLSFDSKLIKDTRDFKDQKSLSIFKFSKKYTKFTICLFGICLLLTTHSGIATYLNNVAESLNLEQTPLFVGASFFIAAVLELPIMGIFDKLNEKFSDTILLYVSVSGFTLKILLMYIGLILRIPSLVFISQFIQIIGFALFLPTSLFYLNSRIKSDDRIKAQSYLGVAITLGNVLSSYIGAKLIFYFNTTYMLFAFFIISLLGTIIVMINTEKRKNE